jgi:hypothetical protein
VGFERLFEQVEFSFYRRERALVVIIPTDVPEQGQKMVEGTLVIDPA